MICQPKAHSPPYTVIIYREVNASTKCVSLSSTHSTQKSLNLIKVENVYY